MTELVSEQRITLKVSEGVSRDVGRGLARIDPKDMERLGAFRREWAHCRLRTNSTQTPGRRTPGP